MKKITILIAIAIISLSSFAEGGKTLGLKSINYSPDPTSGKVKNAINLYTGLGSVYGSSYGLNLGFDFEKPIFDPNLTLGPRFKMGMARYYNPYWDDSGIWHDYTNQMSFYGGVVAHYYFDWLIPNMPDAFDVFVTSDAGYGVVTYSYSGYANYSYFDYGFAVGGRWNFSEKVSLYAQAGYGTSTVLFGLSFKL